MRIATNSAGISMAITTRAICSEYGGIPRTMDKTIPRRRQSEREPREPEARAAVPCRNRYSSHRQILVAAEKSGYGPGGMCGSSMWRYQCLTEWGQLRCVESRRSSRPSMRRTKRFSSPSSLCDIHPRPIHLSQRGGTERFLQNDQGANEKGLDSPSAPPIRGNVPRTHAILSG